MATNEKLKNQLSNQNENSPATPEQLVEGYMRKMAPRFAEVLPKHMSIDRMSRIALTTIRTTRTGTRIIGYKGMIDLARRSGHIQSIYAHAVHENDEFEYELGLHPKLEHKPSHGDRGAFIGAYAVAHFKDGGYQMEFMPKSEIEKRRKRSASANSSYSPWSSDYEEMAKKTVVRYMFKYLPISIKVQTQAQQDEVVRKDITEEPEFIEVDLEEQEELPVEQKEIISEK